MAGMAAKATTAKSAASTINFLIFFSFSLSCFSVPDSTPIGPAKIHPQFVVRYLPFSRSPGRSPPVYAISPRTGARVSGCTGLRLRRASGRISERGSCPGRSRGKSRAELGFGCSQAAQQRKPSRSSRTSLETKTPSSTTKPPQGPAWPETPEWEEETELPSYGDGSWGSSGSEVVPSEGLSVILPEGE